MNFVFAASSIYLSLYPVFNGYYGELLVIKFIMFVLSTFRDSLFAEKAFTHLGTLFDSMQISSKFLLEIMILVSVNIMGINEVFTVAGRSFI
jgi:hypothetical protein